MKAKDTVMKERGVDYDANCGMMIACDILPRYIMGEALESCYTELHKIIEGFVESERGAQAEISFKAGYEAHKKELEKTIKFMGLGNEDWKHILKELRAK